MPQDTNLHKAAYKGDRGGVEDALEAGEDVNARGAQNRTALHRAVGREHNEVVEFLIDKGAEINAVDGGGLSPLHWSALFGLKGTAEILVGAKADIDSQTKSGETPLHFCAEKGKASLVRYLLDQGANTTIRDKQQGGGNLPYDAAKKGCNKEIMDMLKPAGEGCCSIQ